MTLQENIHRKFIGNINKKKTEMLINRPACLGLSIPELSETSIYEFLYD